MKTITVRIHKGQTSVHAEGFAGASCKDATNALEKALGQVTADEATPELYLEIDQEFVSNGGS